MNILNNGTVGDPYGVMQLSTMRKRSNSNENKQRFSVHINQNILLHLNHIQVKIYSINNEKTLAIYFINKMQYVLIMIDAKTLCKYSYDRFKIKDIRCIHQGRDKKRITAILFR